MVDLIGGLDDPSNEGPRRRTSPIFLHVRMLRPFLTLTLMFLSLPLVLGGYGRNMFINLGYRAGHLGALLRHQSPLPVPRRQRRPGPSPGRLAAPLLLRDARHLAVGPHQDVSAAWRPASRGQIR